MVAKKAISRAKMMVGEKVAQKAGEKVNEMELKWVRLKVIAQVALKAPN